MTCTYPTEPCTLEMFREHRACDECSARYALEERADRLQDVVTRLSHSEVSVSDHSCQSDEERDLLVAIGYAPLGVRDAARVALSKLLDCPPSMPDATLSAVALQVRLNELEPYARDATYALRGIAGEKRLVCPNEAAEAAAFLRTHARVAHRLMPIGGEDMSLRDGKDHFGGDCPEGMVQVEFVGCSPDKRHSAYGWVPTERAFLEIYVDGVRYRVDVGDFHDGHAMRRGLHVIGSCDMRCEKTALNACSIWQAKKGGA